MKSKDNISGIMYTNEIIFCSKQEELPIKKSVGCIENL